MPIGTVPDFITNSIFILWTLYLFFTLRCVEQKQHYNDKFSLVICTPTMPIIQTFMCSLI